ncbi:MAG TPA: NUDIX hydrolase [Lactobacillus sp.]|nr:NUDIX hydrolase [Lactobacillus sp.]
MTTDKLNEWWDQYNLAGKIVGQQQRRDHVPTGLYHLVVNAFIFDGQGHVLLQQRSLQKLNHPGAWDCSADGSVLKGETAPAAIQREVDEELGLSDFVQMAQVSTFRGQDWLECWYGIIADFNVADVKRQTSDVAQVALMTVTTAQNQLRTHGIDGVAQQLVIAHDWLTDNLD